MTDGFPNMAGGILGTAASLTGASLGAAATSPTVNAVPLIDATPWLPTISSGQPEEVSARFRAEGGGGVLLKGAEVPSDAEIAARPLTRRTFGPVGFR